MNRRGFLKQLAAVAAAVAVPAVAKVKAAGNRIAWPDLRRIQKPFVGGSRPVYCSYNNIVMQLLKTNSVTIQPETDPSGVDFLYTRVRLDLTLLVAPGATAVGPGGQVFTYNPASPVYGDVTLANIKSALSVPRAPLVFYGDSAVIWRSPPLINGVQTTHDARGDGPIVHGVTVTQVVGSRAFLVRWVGETTLSDCLVPGLGGTGTVPLVSNRWGQAQSVDKRLFTTITTEGVSIFRADVMEAIGRVNGFSLAADYFRDLVIPPCPLGFRRADMAVSMNPLGTILTWRVTDTQVPLNLGSLANGNNPWGLADFNGFLHVSTIPAGSSAGPMHLIGPWVRASLEATAVGHATSSKFNLLAFLAQLVIEKLNLPAPGFLPTELGSAPALQALSVSESLDDKIMRVHADAIWSTLPGVRSNGLGVITPYNQSSVLVLGQDDIATILQYEQGSGTNPNPPYDNGTRGMYWGQMFAQAIQAACTAPLVPTRGQCIQPNYADNFTISCQPLRDAAGNIPVAAGPDLVSNLAATGMTAIKVSYKRKRHHGTHAIPTAGKAQQDPNTGDYISNTPPAVGLLHSPTTYLRACVECQRIGDWPIVPAFKSNDPNLIAIGEPYMTYSNPQILPDGQSGVFTIITEYEMVDLSNAWVGDKIPLGADPAYTLSYADNVWDSSAYTLHGIIDPDQPVLTGAPAGGGAVGPNV